MDCCCWNYIVFVVVMYYKVLKTLTDACTEYVLLYFTNGVVVFVLIVRQVYRVLFFCFCEFTLFYAHCECLLVKSVYVYLFLLLLVFLRSKLVSCCTLHYKINECQIFLLLLFKGL